MRIRLLVIMMALLSLSAVYGQYIVNFEGATETKTAYASGTVNLSGLDWNMTEALIGTSTADWKNDTRSARMRGYGTSSMTMLADKANGLGVLSFQYRRYGTDTQAEWKAEVSINSGVDWTQVGLSFTAPASDVVQTFSEIVNVTGNVRVRIKRATETGTSNLRLNIDDITLTDYTGGTTPTINVSGALAPFSTTTGTPSAAQNYTVSGANLTGNIGIAALTGFQYSLLEGAGYANSLSLSPSGGSVPPTTIYVRLTGAAAGTFSGDIVHSSPGATSVNQAASGTVTNPVPTIYVTGALTQFNTIVGTPSAAQTYTLSGAFLSGNIIVAPLAGFEYSTDGSGYQPQLSLANTFNGLVYVRLTGTTVGTYSGNITHTSTGASPVDLAASGSVTDPSQPTTFLEENFDYIAGTTLVSNGWTAHSGGDVQPVVVATEGLAYTGYYANTGLAAQTVFAGSAQDVHKTFANQTSDTVYSSFLINVSSAATQGDYVFHFGPSPIGTDFKGKVFVKKDASDNLSFGISKASNYNSPILPNYTDFVYSMNTTYLLVVKYIINSGATNDEVYLWVNPVIGVIEPAATLAAPDQTGTDAGGIGAVAIRQGTYTPIARLDGIRVTNAWAELWSGEAPPTPVITVTGELSTFACIVGTPSEEIQSYSLSGENISGGITITPPPEFQVSLNGVDNWQNPLMVSSDFDGLIYVRMYTDIDGYYEGNIVHSSAGATPVNLAISGEAFLPSVVWNIPESLPAFSTQAGTPSANQSYNFSATNATTDLSLATQAPFQLSTTGTGDWQTSLTLAYNYNAPIFVRLNSAGPGTFNGTITHNTADATEGIITISGTATPGAGMAADLFFSEYVEGLSNNKAIEIFNGTGVAVDMSQYTIKLGANGAAWNNTLTPTFTLPHGDTYVIANASASPAILALADVTSTVTYFNGNDAIGLFKDDVLIDMIGIYMQSPNPAVGWDVAGVTTATANHTIVRKPTIIQGNTDFATGAGTNADDSEWIVFDIDNIDNLGLHTFNPGGGTQAATPVLSEPTGVYLEPFGVSITCSTPSSSIYYTLDGTVPTDGSTPYTGSIPISGTTTLKAIAYAPGFVASNVAQAVYTFPVDLPNIAALRASEQGATVYRLTNEVVLTFQQTTRNQKYVQDATAAIVIDDPTGIITSVYNLYDGITGITGTLNNYSSLLQFTPVANPVAATSTGNTVVPAIRTLATITSDDQAKLLRILEVSLDATTVNFTAVPENIAATDASGIGVLRTFPATDYSNTPIPTTPRHIIALGGQFGTTMQFSPRFLSDIYAPQIPDIPTVTITRNGNNVTVSWDYIHYAASYRLEHSDNPYDGYTTLATTNDLSWTGAASATKKFFRVISNEY